MMWYPGRYAFRAGQVTGFGSTFWDAANVGFGSAAFGENTRASGNNSFAAGLATTASGAHSVALGQDARASADRTFSFNGTAAAAGAIAIGGGSQCTGEDCLALGPSAIASGLASVTIGPSIATGSFGIAIGLQNRAEGNFSLALGKNAVAKHSGSIVISDASANFSSDSVASARSNDFTLRASGGARIFTNMNKDAGVRIVPGGSSWSSISDRNRKEHFAAVEGEEILARLRTVPVTTWNYKAQADDIRHMGPMAQDFYAAFELGEDSLRINTIDIDGVMLAGVRALEQRTTDLRAENEALRAELVALRAKLAGREESIAALQHEVSVQQAQQVAERAALDERLVRLETVLLQASAPTEAKTVAAASATAAAEE